MFAEFCENAFSRGAPKKLVMPEGIRDIRPLLHLEAAGLISGATSLGLSHKLTFQPDGYGVISEGDLGVLLQGVPQSEAEHAAVPLTELGVELLSFIPGRDAERAARKFAGAIRSSATTAAWLARRQLDGTFVRYELLWQDNPPLPDNMNSP
jgi:hypothetical protein